MNRRLLQAALSALLLVACSKGSKQEPAALPPPPPIHVETVTIEARPMPRDLPLTGSLIANQQSDVAANAAGRVLKTFVDRGSYVKSGASLVQLDTKGAELSQAEARANLENARAQQELASSLCQRNQSLLEKGAISREEWERISSQCKTSAGSADAARARADLAQKSLSDATVRAPFSGMVTERYVSLGEYVQPPTKVVNLVELDPLRLQVTISEADIGQISEGQQIRFQVEAFPNESFTGTVRYIDPAVRTTTRDLIVEAVVENPDRKLRPGMFATAHLRLPDQAVPAVPKTALRDESGTMHAFVVTEGHVEERIVQTGLEKDGFLVVSDGLKAGEKVVAQPGANVKDGLPVD